MDVVNRINQYDSFNNLSGETKSITYDRLKSYDTFLTAINLQTHFCKDLTLTDLNINPSTIVDPKTYLEFCKFYLPRIYSKCDVTEMNRKEVKHAVGDSLIESIHERQVSSSLEKTNLNKRKIQEQAAIEILDTKVIIIIIYE
jgi:hypothetical protein